MSHERRRTGCPGTQAVARPRRRLRRVEAILSARLWFPAASISASSPADATGVELLLFDREDDSRPARVIPLDPAANRTYHYWHVFVPGASGRARSTAIGFTDRSIPRAACASIRRRFSSTPTAAPSWFRRTTAARGAAMEGDNAATAMKSVVVDPHAYDWEGDTPLQRPSSRTIIYEMHVRGFTAHPSSGVAETKRGTYAGLIEKIPYLQQLGITAVELLPGVPVRCSGCPAGTSQLLGLRAGFVLRAASGVQLASGSARPGRRISRHGQGAAPGRNRGHSRRRLQSHRGRRPSRPDASASADWTTPPTTSSKQTAPGTPTTAAPGTRSTPIIRSSAA